MPGLQLLAPPTMTIFIAPTSQNFGYGKKTYSTAEETMGNGQKVRDAASSRAMAMTLPRPTPLRRRWQQLHLQESAAMLPLFHAMLCDITPMLRSILDQHV